MNELDLASLDQLLAVEQVRADARAQKAAENAKFASPQPVGWNQALHDLASGRNEDGADPVGDRVVDGLASEDGKDVALRQAEALTRGLKAATLEDTQDGQTETDGHQAHAEPPRCDLQPVTGNIESVNPELLSAWRAWVDDEHRSLANEVEHFDLQSLAAATCEGASATDSGFAERLIENTWCDANSGSVYRRRAGDAEKRWEQYLQRKPALVAEQAEAIRAHFDRLYPQNEMGDRRDAGSHVQIIRDHAHVFSGGASEPFVRDYLRTLPPGWAESIVVSLPAGSNPVVCRWTEQRLLIGATREWARLFRLPNGEPRFAVLEAYDFGNAPRVMVPAATAARVAGSLAELAARTIPDERCGGTEVWPTGVAGLDAALSRMGGIPRGARVVVQAPATGQSKTTLMLEIAENFAARGLNVVWLATGDDPRPAIQGRRRQRAAGMTQEEGFKSKDESMLNPRLLVFDGRAHDLEDVLRYAAEIDVLFLDPVTKIRTRCATDDPLTVVGHVLNLLENAGLTAFMAVPNVRGAKRRAPLEQSFGGSRVEAGASVVLDLHRQKTDVTIGILKSRYGGEDSELHVQIDLERQRIVAPAAGAVVTSAADRIKSDVLRVVAERGPRSARALLELVRGKNELVRAAVRELLAAGELVAVEGQKVGLP